LLNFQIINENGIIFSPIEEAMPEENEEDEEGGLDQPGTSGDKQQS
jgi:hypothetical protein